MSKKRCYDCGNIKFATPEYFYRNKTNKDGLSGQCIVCKKAWRESPAGKASARKARKRYKGTPKGKQAKKREQKRYRKHYNKSDSKKNSRLKHLYGITLDERLTMYIMQGGRCAVCKQAVALDEIVVDHNRLTSKIRGLLCGSCNSALGFTRDNTQILQNAINYLEKHR